jgi:hypothetical protein
MIVDLQKLTSIINPLLNPPWAEVTAPIKIEEIENASAQSHMEYDPFKPETRQKHIERIAFFAKNGWQDEPISIVLRSNVYPIYDGNHRLCAAIFRGDSWIAANVEGDIQKIKSIAY